MGGTPYERALQVVPDRAHIERIDWGRGVGAQGGPVIAMTDGRWLRLERERAVALNPADDGDLPATRNLAGWLGGRTAEVLSHRPGRRLVLLVRGTGSGERGRVYKAYRRGRLRAALDRHRLAIRAAAGSRWNVPAVLDVDERLDLVGFELLPGDAPDLARLAAEPEIYRAMFRELVELFGREREEALPLHGPEQELEVLELMARRAVRLRAELPPGWVVARDRVTDTFARELASPPEAWSLAHRDLHDGQLLRDGDRFGLLDFDLLCCAESSLDPANLSIYSELIN